MAGCEPTTDKKWQVESDARTLLESQEIRMDKSRYARARKELATIVKRAQKEAAAKKAQAGLEKAIKE